LSARRLLVALGGNAIAHEGKAGPGDQQIAVETAMDQVAELVAAGYEVALTHGNGPQVGNLLLKNELARKVVPAVPLDWCVAQTQATIGYLITTALEAALAGRGAERAIAVVVTRVLVDSSDPALSRPTKPIGRHFPKEDALRRVADGETWQPDGELGWRRLVPSPDPNRILDQDSVVRLLDDGAVVIAAGGGGIPMVREGKRLRGVEAVIDKDLCGSLLATQIGAEVLLIATDVPGVALDPDAQEPEWLGKTSPARLRELAAEGRFPAGSMGPKVEACLRFLGAGGSRAVIASLDHLLDAARGEAGTIVEPNGGAG
jgi:carbamate kinase